VNCWVTDGAAGASIGENDIDGGKTTLFSPVWDLSTYTDAAVEIWSWYSNDEGSEPAQDYFVVDASSNGGTDWVNLLTTNNDWEYWRKDYFVLDGYMTLTNQVQLRIVASDEDPGSVVEAAVDDVCLYASNPLPPDSVTDVTAYHLSEGNILLTWSSTGATEYNIYSDTNPFGIFTTLEGTVSDTSFILETTATKLFLIVKGSNAN
jgi:hypothetical protein